MFFKVKVMSLTEHTPYLKSHFPTFTCVVCSSSSVCKVQITNKSCLRSESEINKKTQGEWISQFRRYTNCTNCKIPSFYRSSLSQKGEQELKMVLIGFYFYKILNY